MNYVELNLFPEEEEEIQKDSDSDGSKKNRSVESNEYDYAVKRKYEKQETAISDCGSGSFVFLDNIPKTRYNRTNRIIQKGAPPCKRFLPLQN